jgi:hypothetical protein
LFVLLTCRQTFAETTSSSIFWNTKITNHKSMSTFVFHFFYMSFRTMMVVSDRRRRWWWHSHIIRWFVWEPRTNSYVSVCETFSNWFAQIRANFVRKCVPNSFKNLLKQNLKNCIEKWKNPGVLNQLIHCTIVCNLNL